MQLAFAQLLRLGPPFIDANMLVGSKRSFLLMILAERSGFPYYEVVDKAIVLIKSGNDVLQKDMNGDSVLHALLNHYYRSYFTGHQNYLHYCQPKDLLLAFIAAGPDVYAVNNAGRTPTMIARQHGRLAEWTKALSLCGYDPYSVLAHSVYLAVHKLPPVRTESKLSFGSFCTL